MNTKDSRYNKIIALFGQLTSEEAAKVLEFAKSLVEQRKNSKVQ